MLKNLGVVFLNNNLQQSLGDFKNKWGFRLHFEIFRVVCLIFRSVSKDLQLSSEGFGWNSIDHFEIPSMTIGSLWPLELFIEMYTCIIHALLILFCSWLMCTGRLHISFFSQSESINFFECIINTVTYSCTHVQFFLGDCASNVRSTTFSKLPRRFPLRFWCPSPLKDQL